MDILNGEVLLRYASPEAFPKDQTEIPTSVFNDLNLSCDWKRLIPNPQFSHHITSGRSVIISITICDEIRRPTNPRGVQVPSSFQEVLHDPIPEDEPFGPNEAHSLIRGRKKQEAINALRRNSIWTK
jgi:hypothetical protein